VLANQCYTGACLYTIPNAGGIYTCLILAKNQSYTPITGPSWYESFKEKPIPGPRLEWSFFWNTQHRDLVALIFFLKCPIGITSSWIWFFLKRPTSGLGTILIFLPAKFRLKSKIQIQNKSDFEGFQSQEVRKFFLNNFQNWYIWFSFCSQKYRSKMKDFTLISGW
jgi:hypothetical protein